jgi:hypothetical protein
VRLSEVSLGEPRLGWARQEIKHGRVGLCLVSPGRVRFGEARDFYEL